MGALPDLRALVSAEHRSESGTSGCCLSQAIACPLTAAAQWVDSAAVNGRTVPRQGKSRDMCRQQHPHQQFCKGRGGVTREVWGPNGPMLLLPASCSIAAVQASQWEEVVEDEGLTVPRQRQLRDVYKYHGVELLDLVRQLLHPDPAKRLTPQQALCHPYVHRQAVKLKVSTAWCGGRVQLDLSVVAACCPCQELHSPAASVPPQVAQVEHVQVSSYAGVTPLLLLTLGAVAAF